MIPPTKQYEKVTTDDFISGEITDVQYENEHEFTFKGQKTIALGIRFVLTLNGYKDRKPTRWMKFNYSEKSTLYLKYISALVENAKPNMPFDADQFVGTKIKVLFKDSPDGKYQNLEIIRPFDKKVVYDPNFSGDAQEPPF